MDTNAEDQTGQWPPDLMQNQREDDDTISNDFQDNGKCPGYHAKNRRCPKIEKTTDKFL